MNIGNTLEQRTKHTNEHNKNIVLTHRITTLICVYVYMYT